MNIIKSYFYVIFLFIAFFSQEAHSMRNKMITLNNSAEKIPNPLLTPSNIKYASKIENSNALFFVKIDEPDTLYYAHEDRCVSHSCADKDGETSIVTLQGENFKPHDDSENLTFFLCMLEKKVENNINYQCMIGTVKIESVPSGEKQKDSEEVQQNTLKISLQPWIGITSGIKSSSLQVAGNTYVQQKLKSLYNPFYVSTDNNNDSIAIAIQHIRLQHNNEKKTFELVAQPLVSANAITDNCIIGARGAHLPVSIHDINSMETSTGLSYLLVLGGSGLPENTKRKVFALPLVNMPGHEHSGMLAKKNSIPYESFVNQQPYRFIGRYFDTPAEYPGDLFQEDDAPARVGGTVHLNSDIQYIALHGDTIHAVMQDDKHYYSQALFDHYGRIKSWTDWAIINKKPLFNDADKKIILNEKVTSLIQCNYLNCYSATTTDKLIFIDQLDHTKTIVYDHKILAEIAPLSSIISVDDGDQQWIIVGGAHGCAVLMQENGSGIAHEISYQDFTTMQEHYSCKKIGQFSHVKKLLADNNTLYIMNANRLDRVTLSPEALKNQSLTITETATAGSITQQKYGLFNDCLIANKLCLLATTEGLFRNNNGSDIAQLDTLSDWHKIPLEEHVGPITKLFAISSSHHHDNIYVLNAHRGHNQARIYRLSVDIADEITDTTVQQLPDCFIKNKKSFFINVGDYRTGLYTNGGNIFLYNNAHAPTKQSPFCEVLQSGWQSGRPFATRSSIKMLQFPHAHCIGNLLRSHVTGNMVIYGDFGVYTYE
ncbi:MAG: hypothetical protein WC707_06530 [Candidatus Babeliaceae bacterium]